MEIKLATQLMKSYLRKVLAQENSYDIYKVLRSYSSPKKPIDESNISYFLRKDPDVYKASDIDDVSDMAPYTFTMLDEDGNSSEYRFAVYRLNFTPEKANEINDVNVDVDGRDMDLKKDEIINLISQGKANKYIGGVESKDDKSKPFAYDVLGIEAPEAKMEYVIVYDDKTNSIRPRHQINEIQGEYSGYTKILTKKVAEYNKSLADKITVENPPAAGAPPAGAPPMPPPPPMGGMGGGMPPMM